MSAARMHVCVCIRVCTCVSILVFVYECMCVCCMSAVWGVDAHVCVCHGCRVLTGVHVPWCIHRGCTEWRPRANICRSGQKCGSRAGTHAQQHTPAHTPAQTHARAHARTHTYTHLRTHARTCARARAQICTHMQACMHTPTYLHQASPQARAPPLPPLVAVVCGPRRS